MLNHLVITLDSATYRDINASPFLRGEFAAFDTSSVGSAGYIVGVRLFGKYNYVGLTEPTAYRRARVGDVAIVLGTEVPKGLDRLAQDRRLQLGTQLPIDGPRDRIDYLFDEVSVVALAGPDSTSDHARFEIVQYGEALAKLLSNTDSLPPDRRSNSRFLARYYDPHRLLSHLTAATLAIPVDDIAKIAAVLQRDSVTVLHEGEGAIINLDGFTLHLIPPWTGAGVKQLQFALTREVMANPVYRFGPHSQLRFGPGAIAVWDFIQR